MTTEKLNLLLADYSVLYQKLRGFHWNVRGPMFFTLHAKFEELYTSAAMRVDEVAERIAALGGRPLSTLEEYLEVSRIKEDADSPNAEAMVAGIRDDYLALNEALRAVAATAAEAGDSATEGYAIEVVTEQEQTIWMLNAHLDA